MNKTNNYTTLIPVDDKILEITVKVLPKKTELTEDDVLKIIKEGNKEYREGKTTDFDTLIKEKYPHLLKK